MDYIPIYISKEKQKETEGERKYVIETTKEGK